MSNTVSQPVAQRLRKAGWKKLTCEGYGRNHVFNSTVEEDWYRWEGPNQDYHNYDQWLPAPNISELREDLTRINFRDYWFHEVRCADGLPEDFEIEYSGWLYAVTASADKLAEVWMWKEEKK